MISVRGDEVLTASTEIFDPQAGTLKPSGKLSVPRAGHTATLLRDGNVLITGGGNERANFNCPQQQCAERRTARAICESRSPTITHI